MRTKRRRSWPMAPLVALVLTGLGVVPSAPAAAQEAPTFVVTLDGLLPGVAKSRTATITLERAGELRKFGWVQRTGILADAALHVTVCTTGGRCADADSPAASPVFPAAELTVTVTATLSESARSGGTGSAIGQLTFAGQKHEIQPGGSGSIASTGVEVLAVLAWAMAATSIGTALVVWARRRQPAD